MMLVLPPSHWLVVFISSSANCIVFPRGRPGKQGRSKTLEPRDTSSFGLKTLPKRIRDDDDDNDNTTTRNARDCQACETLHRALLILLPFLVITTVDSLNRCCYCCSNNYRNVRYKYHPCVPLLRHIIQLREIRQHSTLLAFHPISTLL